MTSLLEEIAYSGKTKIMFGLPPWDVEVFKQVLKASIGYWTRLSEEVEDEDFAKRCEQRVRVCKTILREMRLIYDLKDVLKDVEPFDDEIIKGNKPENMTPLEQQAYAIAERQLRERVEKAAKADFGLVGMAAVVDGYNQICKKIEEDPKAFDTPLDPGQL